MSRIILLANVLWLLGMFCPLALSAAEPFVTFSAGEGAQCITGANISFDRNEYPGVLTAITNLQDDFERVTGRRPAADGGGRAADILIGTVGRSKAIDRLLKKGLLPELKGRREKYVITVADGRLVIAGSDKRGTIYGIYELSRQMGVSPWYYWADVPVVHHDEVYVRPGVYTDGEPKVRYRGLFLNDEAPCLTGWAGKTFGGFNHKFYEKVFELILRMKGNFIWPAMWGSAFYDDDPENGPTADRMGVMVGLSHHEPMSCSQAEWHRTEGSKVWDYTKNKEKLQDFWAGGVRRNRNTEDVVTVGMRGDGDEAMSEDTNVELLQRIVDDQRAIIARERKCKAEEVPQVWALYKEVQDYYHNGMRVPDDVTLLLCDNNWGSLRMLPSPDEPKRKGGYGIYYHYDYVGGPRCYRWLNVSQIQRVWADMNMAYENGADRLWIVNVGDLKPMEFPMQFWFDMAWNPERFNAGNLFEYTVDYCRATFGQRYAEEAARLLNLACKYAHRRTPELMNRLPYSVENYDEFRRVTADYNSLEADAERLYRLLEPQYRDAFMQIVRYPVMAMANLYRMYYASATGDSVATQHWFDRDAALTKYYNDTLCGGKWKHMMDQTHISYTSWASPKVDVMPEIKSVPSAGCNAGKCQEATCCEKWAKGVVSIEAPHYYEAKAADGVSWTFIPDYGKTMGALTLLPTNRPVEGSEVTYRFRADGDYDKATLHCLFAPMLDYTGGDGIWYEVSVDGGSPQKVNLIASAMSDRERDRLLRNMPEGHFDQNRIIDSRTVLTAAFRKGHEHTVTLRPLSRGILLEKLIVDFGGMKPSYLGTPETPFAVIPGFRHD